MKKKITIKDEVYFIQKSKDGIYTLQPKDSSKLKLPWLRKSTGKMVYKLKTKKEVLAAKVIYLANNFKNPNLEDYKNYVCVFNDDNPQNLELENISLFERSEYKKLKLTSKKIIMIPDGREFNSINDAAKYLTTIGNGNIKTYSSEISRIVNHRSSDDGTKRITILGKSFKFKNGK